MNILAKSMIVTAFLAVIPLSAFGQQYPMMEHMYGPGGMGAGSQGHGMGMGGHGMGMPGHGMGMDGCETGIMGGHWGGGILGPISLLDLNPDQQTRIGRIENDLRKQLWSLQGKTIDTRSQLRELYAADKPDAKKISEVYAQIFDVRRQMIEARINAMNRARDVLNKEQLSMLKQFQQRYHRRCFDFD